VEGVGPSTIFDYFSFVFLRVLFALIFWGWANRRLDPAYKLAGIRWSDEETFGNVLLMDSIFVGDGGIPHTPPCIDRRHRQQVFGYMGNSIIHNIQHPFNIKCGYKGNKNIRNEISDFCKVELGNG
jgi:hypothetical protein